MSFLDVSVIVLPTEPEPLNGMLAAAWKSPFASAGTAASSAGWLGSTPCEAFAASRASYSAFAASRASDSAFAVVARRAARRPDMRAAASEVEPAAT